MLFLMLLRVGLSRGVLPDVGWGGDTTIQGSTTATCTVSGTPQSTPGICLITCPDATWTTLTITTTNSVELYTCVPQAELSSLSPTYIYDAVETAISVQGNNFFDAGTEVLCKYGTVTVSGHYVSPSQATCAWLSLLVGSYSLSISFNRYDWTNSLPFTVKSTPRVHAVTTNSQYLPATLIVTGAYFVSGLQCFFESYSATVLTVSGTKSGTCAVPSNVQGTVVLRVIDSSSIVLSGDFSLSFLSKVGITATFPSYINTNSHIEVFGSGFNSSLKCGWNGTGKVTTWRNSGHLTCSTANLAAGSYALTLVDSSGNVVSTNTISVTIHADHFVMTMSMQGNNTLIALSPTPPAGNIYCKIGNNPGFLMTVSGQKWVCPTGKISDIGTLCIELSFNNGYDYTSDCQKTIWLPRTSRTISLTPTIFPLTGGKVQITGVQYYSDSSYQCQMTYPNGSVKLVAAVMTSTTLLTCTVQPATLSGQTQVQVVQNGGTMLEILKFVFVDYIEPVSLEPSRIMLTGNSLVTFTALHIPEPTECIFTCGSGTQYLSPATVLSSSTATCLSPDFTSEGPGEVMVSLYEFDGSISHSINITVVPEPVLQSISPDFAFEGLPTTLYLQGSEFIPVTELQAKLTVSAQLLSTVYLSPSLLEITLIPLSFNHRIHEKESVALTVNGVDFYGSVDLTIYPSPSLGQVSISKGPWQGGYTVKLYGNGFVRDGQCVFGEESGLGVVEAYSTMVCTAPMQVPGVVRVAVEVLQNVFADKPVKFTYLGFSEFSFSPRSGPLSGGTLVTITGVFNWIQSTDTIECSFGSQLVPASFSNRDITCTSPPHPVSELVELHLVVSGFDYTQSGLTSDQYFYEKDPTLGVASTYVYASQGGTLVELEGVGFQWRSPWKCHFGGIMENLYVLNATLAACFSPDTPFGVTGNLLLSSDMQHFLQFSEPFAIVPDPSIYLCTPAKGPHSGGTLVTLTGNFLTSVVTCRFGDMVSVPATVISNYEVTCQTPAWVVPALVQVDVSVNGQFYTDSGVMFQYYDLPLVASVTPQLVPIDGGTTLVIRGDGFIQPTLCRINSIVIPSEFISPNEIHCKSPVMTTPGTITIELSFNGLQYHGFNRAVYTAYGDLVVSEIQPKYGVPGTIVTVTGSGFTDLVAFSCQFGDTEAIWKRLVTPTEVQCQTPSLPPGPYRITISINGVDYVGSLDFTVHWELAILGSVPLYTSPDGGTVFTVESLYWPENTSLAKCGFRLTDPEIHTSQYSNAEFVDSFNTPASVTNRLATCSAPSFIFGAAHGKITLSSDTQIYSSSSTPVVFYEGSFQGFYRQSSLQIECPSGSFCRTERWYSPSLCEPGYYQPAPRQRKCLTCPPGNYCPDRGLTKPKPCDAGRICPSHGLTGVLLDCPRGFFCFSETILASFWGDSPYHLKPQMSTLSGKYSIVGATQQSDSFQCTSGFFCPLASREHTGVVSCPAGFYCVDNVIYACPPRHYCPERGNVAPELCPAGTYNPYPSQSRCLVCSYGSVCPHSGMLQPQDCPLGYICNETGLTNPTAMCTAGYYCDGLVTSAYTERPCRIITDLEALSLSFCGADVMITKANPDNISDQMLHFTGKTENMCCWSPKATGQFLYNIHPSVTFQRLQQEAEAQGMTGMDLYRLLANPPVSRELQESTRTVHLTPIRPSDVDKLMQSLKALMVYKQPTPCPPGMFCLQKTGSDSLTGQFPPYQCNPGTYCELAASSPQGTALCPAGYYCPAGTSKPLEAQPGYRTELSGNVNPAPCMPGYFSNESAKALCLPCPSGFECPNSGTVWPTSCPPGTYRTSGLQSRCASCPVRSWSYDKGLTSQHYCLPCPAGRLCSQPGIQAVSQTYPCIEGDICTEAAALTSRPACPAGYLCPMGTSPDTQYEYECIDGFFCKSRTPYRNKYLLQCPSFSYCPPATPDYEVFYSTEGNFTGLSFPPTMCPAGTGHDGKSGKKELLDCTIDEEFSLETTPREYVIEVNPVDVSLGTEPTGYFDTDRNPLKLPYYSLDSFDVALITLDLRHLDLASGLLAYGLNWGVAVTVNTNGDISNRTVADPIPMPLNFLNETVPKNSVLEFTLQSWVPLNFTISVLFFNGLLLSEEQTFYSTTSVEIFSPNRASYGTRDVFMAVFDSSVSLPYNVPSSVSDQQPEYLLSFAESPQRYPEIKTPAVDGYNWFSPNSMFWQGQDNYMTPYLPYFSNCKGYGAYIPIWALLELHPSCDLVAPENTTFVAEFAFGAKPNADSCSNITIECLYDEVPNNQQPNPRWWEQTNPNYVFLLTQTPVSPEDFLGGNQPPTVTVDIVNLNMGSGLPRTVTLDIKYQQVDTKTKKIIQASITFSDFEDVTNDQNSGLAITKYNLIVNFSALTHTELMILFQFTLSFYTVLNLIIGFAMIGGTAVFLVYHRILTKAKPVPRCKFWGFVVMIFPAMLAGMLLATIPVYIMCLLIGIFIEGTVWTEILSYPGNTADGSLLGMFDTIKPSYDPQDVTDMTMYRHCRVAVSLMLLGLYLLGVASALFIPYSEREKRKLYQEDKKGNVLRTVYWRRFSFVFITVLTCCGSLLLIFFSYSDYFALNVYPCVAALQALGWVYEESMEGIIGSALMKSPIMTCIAVIQGLCTFGASNLVEYLQAGFVDFTIMLHNRMFHEDIKQWTAEHIKGIFKTVRLIVVEGGIHNKAPTATLDELPLPQTSDRSAPAARMPSDPAEEQSISSIEDSDSASFYTYEEVRESPPPSEHAPELLLEQDVEPLLDNLGDYTADIMGMAYGIIIITIMWYFYDTTQVIANYGIEKDAVALFFLYAVMMLPVQFVIDVILHNCNELFNGWAMHDFLDHLSLRYRSRTTSWAVCDTQNADFIEEENRTLYKTCFSSQYYFMCTIHCSGMVMVILAIHVFLINDGYNIFQDRALLVIVPFIFLLCAIVHYGSYKFGQLVRLWHIPTHKDSHSETEEVNFRELVDTFMQARETKPSRVVPAIQNWMQVDLVKAGDEVIRRELNSTRLREKKVRDMFLSENREWLQHNLEHILTINNLKKHRGVLLDKFREMFGPLSHELTPRIYSDFSTPEEIEPLSSSSARVMMYWVSRARRIQRLRTQTEGLIFAHLGKKCQYCGSQSALQCELIESIEDLFFRFKATQRPPLRFQANVWEVGEWLHFVQREGHFRTLCLGCLALCDKFNAEAAKMRKKERPEVLPRRNRAVNFADAPEEVAEGALVGLVRVWLEEARRRLRQSEE